MSSKKSFEVDGERYECARLTPVAGSYLYMRLLNAMMAVAAASADRTEEADAEPAKDYTAEQKARNVIGIGFMRLSLEDMQTAFDLALKVVLRLDQTPVGEQAFPIMTTGGVLVPAALGDNPAVLQRIVTEVLVFTLQPFFEVRTGQSS